MIVKSITKMMTKEIWEEVELELEESSNSIFMELVASEEVFDEIFLENDLKEYFINHYDIPIRVLRDLIDEAYPFVSQKNVEFLHRFEIINSSDYEKYTQLYDIEVKSEVALTERQYEIIETVVEELKRIYEELFMKHIIEIEEVPENETEKYGERFHIVTMWPIQ